MENEPHLKKDLRIPPSATDLSLADGDLSEAATTRISANTGTAPITGAPIAVDELSTVDLVKHISSEVGHLAKKQIELAKTELKADLKSELLMVGGLSVAGILGICTLNLLLVTVVFGLATVLPGWQAGLIVSGATLVAASVTGWLAWSKRVQTPLERTQRTVKDNLQWTRERVV
jgi:uncharacterized membrane protein YqjE